MQIRATSTCPSPAPRAGSEIIPARGPASAGDAVPGAAGFTLLELIIVIAVIGILATIALPAMKDIPRRANEAVLKTNLHTMRDVIDQRYADKGSYPPTLQALVDEGYLRAIPVDPFTRSSETWVEVFAEVDPDEIPAETDLPEDGSPGVVDVHSASELTSLDGTSTYAEW